MMKTLFKLQRQQWINALKSQELKNYIAYLVIFGALFFIMFSFSKTVWGLAGTLSDSVLLGIFSYCLLMIIASIVLIGMPQVFKHLYSATDLELLFTLPIQTRHIFLMKFIQSFAGTPLFVFFFFLVPFAAYGIASGVFWLYYVVLIIILLATVIIGLSIAYLLNLIVVQIVPASRANEFMTAMSFLSGLAIYLMFMYPQLSSDQSYTDIMMDGIPMLPSWLPMSWGSDAIISSLYGEWHTLLPLLLYVLLAIVLMLIATIVIEKGFRRGWIRLSEGGRKKKKRQAAQKRKAHISHPVIAIGKKEWLSIKRDLREWLAYLPIAFFIVFPLIGFLSGGGDINAIRGYHEISWPITQVFLLLMYALFNGQLAASAISREGESLWILRTLPLSGWHIALGKLWISWLIPFVILTTIELAAGLFLDWQWWQSILGIIIKACITVGLSAIGIWIGTIGGRYNPANPQQRLTFMTSFLLLIISYVYIMVMLFPYALLIIPGEAAPFVAEVSYETSGFIGIVLSFFNMFMAAKVTDPWLLVGQAIIFLMILAVGIAWLFLKVSAGRIDRGIKIDIVTNIKRTKLFNRKQGKSLY